MSGLADARARLLARQQPDGGFGPRPGRASRTEETALAALALSGHPGSDASIEAALRWLASSQHDDGSWPVGADVAEPSWATALAVIALARLRDGDPRALAGARWLLGQEGRRPSLKARLLHRLRSQHAVEQDPDLRGWSWVASASSWVEPTAHALAALKQLEPLLLTGTRDRIQEGEALVYDRMCRGGGWNYGNSVVLGEALEPYPDTTAIALLALCDHASRVENQQSLDALEAMLPEHDSALSLAWSLLCLRAYGREPGALRARLETALEARHALDDTRSLALAALALGEDDVVLGASA